MPNKRLINQTNLPLKEQFILQLRDEYHIKGTTLLACFWMYIGFMKMLGDIYLTEMTPWQIIDYKTAIENYKTMWHRTRRGGKSIGLSVLGVFFAIIKFGYRANAGCVVWRAPFSDQLDQAKKWLRLNPFVTWISGDGDVEVILSEPIDMSCLGSGKVASRGVSIFIMDEYKKVKNDSIMGGDAKEAYGMCAEGPNAQRRMISASTGARLTEFHNQFLSNEWEYCLHTWHECPWIFEEFIESERLGNPADPWYVPQEYECVWVARGGTAFKNVYVVDTVNKMVTHNEEQFKFGDHPFFPLNWVFPTPRKAGVDFNDAAGHYVMTGSMDDDAIYLNKEYVVSTIAELRPFGLKYSMEVESGPFKINIVNSGKCTKLGIKCKKSDWTGGLTKAKRFKLFMTKMIIIDGRECTFTKGNLEAAVIDPNHVETTLKKDSQQHGLDASFHMAHSLAALVKQYKRKIITMQNEPNQVNIF